MDPRRPSSIWTLLMKPQSTLTMIRTKAVTKQWGWTWTIETRPFWINKEGYTSPKPHAAIKRTAQPPLTIATLWMPQPQPASIMDILVPLVLPISRQPTIKAKVATLKQKLKTAKTEMTVTMKSSKYSVFYWSCQWRSSSHQNDILCCCIDPWLWLAPGTDLPFGYYHWKCPWRTSHIDYQDDVAKMAK